MADKAKMGLQLVGITWSIRTLENVLRSVRSLTAVNIYGPQSLFLSGLVQTHANAFKCKFY